MNEDIKEFISKNRVQFDDELPPPELWDRISSKLDSQTQINRQRRLLKQGIKLAATLLLIASVSTVIYLFGKKHAYADYVTINPALAAEQETYTALIVQKKDSIAFIAASNPVLYNEFTTVLEQMEANYNLLKYEYEKSPNKAITLEAMIRNLQAQIQVLSRQLEILHDLNDTSIHQTKNNEQI